MPSINPTIDYSRYLNSAYYNFYSGTFLISGFRQLKHLTSSELYRRYKAIIRNQATLLTEERDSYRYHNVWLSSWFWIRKQMETEKEYKLRNIRIPKIDLKMDLKLFEVVPPITPRTLNSSDFVVKFGNITWLKEMLTSGKVMLSNAKRYANDDMNEAQQDEEIAKHIYINGDNTRIIRGRSQTHIVPTGKVRYTKYLDDVTYYIVCACNEFDVTLFHDFEGYDACLLIKDSNEFAARLKTAWNSKYKDWYFMHSNIEYYDEYSDLCITKNDYNFKNRINPSPVLHKSFAFAYQKEYRFWFYKQNSKLIEDYVFLELGDLRDIAEIYTKDSLLKELNNGN